MFVLSGTNLYIVSKGTYITHILRCKSWDQGQPLFTSRHQAERQKGHYPNQWTAGTAGCDRGFIKSTEYIKFCNRFLYLCKHQFSMPYFDGVKTGLFCQHLIQWVVTRVSRGRRGPRGRIYFPDKVEFADFLLSLHDSCWNIFWQGCLVGTLKGLKSRPYILINSHYVKC